MICCAASRSVPVRRERCAVEGRGGLGSSGSGAGSARTTHLITHFSLLTAHCSLLTTHYSPYDAHSFGSSRIIASIALTFSPAVDWSDGKGWAW